MKKNMYMSPPLREKKIPSKLDKKYPYSLLLTYYVPK